MVTERELCWSKPHLWLCNVNTISAFSLGMPHAYHYPYMPIYRSATSTMSVVVSNVSRLKPEIRLAQAVSQFEADLSSEQKAAFRTYRSQSLDSPPDPRDVMRLTAEIDRQNSGNIGRGRCFGPRLTNFLQAVQQFAALGDVIIGGSQNLIACGVWTIVRMSLLVSLH